MIKFYLFLNIQFLHHKVNIFLGILLNFLEILEIEGIVSSFDCQPIDQNQILNLTRKICENLEIVEFIEADINQMSSFSDFRILCNEENYDQMLSDPEYVKNINKFWNQIEDVQTITMLKFSKKFENFEIHQQNEDDDSSNILFQQILNEDTKDKLKYNIDFTTNNISSIRMKYIDSKLFSIKLYNQNKEKIISFKSRKKLKNKNISYYNFNFIKKVKYLIPIFVDNSFTAFLLKYDSNSEIQNLKESDENILIPNNHNLILENLKEIDLRIDLSYYLSGIFLYF